MTRSPGPLLFVSPSAWSADRKTLMDLFPRLLVRKGYVGPHRPRRREVCTISLSNDLIQQTRRTSSRLVARAILEHNRYSGPLFLVVISFPVIQ